MNTDVYAIITNRLIAQLESGVIAWRARWRGGADCPRNLVSKKPYRGINRLLLSTSEFASPDWLTFNKARELGGRIAKGAKSELVVFWKTFNREQGDDTAAASDTDSRTKCPPVLRYYHVFNLEQTAGLERFTATAATANESITASSVKSEGSVAVARQPRVAAPLYGQERNVKSDLHHRAAPRAQTLGMQLSGL